MLACVSANPHGPRFPHQQHHTFILLYTLPETPENASLWSQITSSMLKDEKLMFSHVEAHFTTNALVHAAGQPLHALLVSASESALTAAPLHLSKLKCFTCSQHSDNVSHNTPERYILKKEGEEKNRYKGKAEVNSAQEEDKYYNAEETVVVAMMSHVHISEKIKILLFCSCCAQAQTPEMDHP